MGKRIDVTIAQSTEAAKSASQTAISVATVAHSTRDLAISHEEMSRYAIQAEETARGAACEAKLAAARISELAETAEQVGQVVGIIREVAAQINLLALNATIEAARAGEAGRGFAVVANEVKALAAQTSQASAGVGDLIQASQSATRAATDAIARIAIAVAQTHEIATSVASVSQEQSVTTKVISGATEDAAARTGEVLALARNVSDGMRLTEEAAGEFERASTLLSTEGDRVQASVVAFLERIRAA
jgi:methyl-accepting chemotaxis protein